MIHALSVRFRLYGINNIMHFHTSSQYWNWCDAMETNFKDWFEIVEVIPYDI